MLQSTREQRLLEPTDRDQCTRRLRGQLPQIRCLVRLAQRWHVAHDRTAGGEVSLATRSEQRDDLRVANVDTEVREIREVARTSDQQLRADTRVLIERRPAVDDQRREIQTRALHRKRKAD